MATACEIRVDWRAADIPLFDIIGIALRDPTVCHMSQRRAIEAGIGSRIAWPW